MSPEVRHFVEIDEYVPLTVQWSGYSHLREAPQSIVLDAGASLVEVKTHRESGEVVELILIDIGQPENFDTSLNASAPVLIDSGVPLVSFKESSQDRSVGGVDLYVDGLRLRLGEGHTARVVGSQDAAFGFSDPGHLVEFDLRLDPDRMAQLRAVACARH
ncbi:hypothetical protein ACICHK_14730 [Streptomyces sp. AHU1]|uniref:hypothetical protein n=1 Tax=Streptomyces sp. AHU1 TaxID=3377215 RepID=UPI003877A0DD